MLYKEFFSKYIKNLKINKNHQANGICPFHNDQRASFSVNLSNGLWKCHAGCGEGNTRQFAKRMGISIREIPNSRTSLSQNKYLDSKIIAIYDYKDEKGNLLFQVVRCEPKSFYQRRLDKNGNWIYNLSGVKRVLYQLPRLLSNPDPVIIVEGEKDANRLWELGFTATTNPGGAGKWRDEYNDYLKNREVVIIPDNDEVGKKHALQIAKSLSSAKSVKIVEIPNLPPKSDVSDFLNNGGTAEDLRKLIEKTPSINFSSFEKIEESLKATIVEIRKNQKLKSFEKKAKISQLIIDDLKTKGFLISTDEERYFFYEKEKKTLPLNDFRFSAFIGEEYGINSSESEWDYLLAELHKEAYVRGKHSEVHKFTCYKNKCLYISRFNGEIYRLDGEKVVLIPNGSDEIFFLDNPTYTPYQYLGSEFNEENFYSLLVKPINFVSDKDVILTPEEQGFLWQLWIYSLFFESLLPTKPILLFLGEKGSGKTSTLRWLLHFLFGPKAEVFSLAKNKEDAFITTITNSYLACFDNVDGRIEWLNDHLATVSTGGAIALRKLYTTNERIIYKPKVFIALTSRTPKFKRDDIVDRLLIFRVKRLTQFSSEKNLLDERLSKRDKIWTELLNHLNQIVAILKSNNLSLKTNYRMSDWAELAWKIAESHNRGDEFLKILSKMQKEQSIFLLEDEPIFQTLEIWLKEENNQGREIIAKTLREELEKIAREEKIFWPYETPMSLAKRLQNILSNLEEFFQIETKSKKGHEKVYSFIPLKNQ